MINITGILRKHARETATSGIVRYYILSFPEFALRHAMVEAFIMKLAFVKGDVVWRQTRQGRTGARVHSTGALQAAEE